MSFSTRAARQLVASDGFTLIEVLVAIALLAIVLGAVGEVVGTTVKGVHSIDRRLPLLETAQNLLVSLPDRGLLTAGSQSGTTDGLQWRVDVVPIVMNAPERAQPSITTTVEATQVPLPKWQPYQITVRVQGNSGPPVRLDTVRMLPIQSTQQRPAG